MKTIRLLCLFCCLAVAAERCRAAEIVLRDSAVVQDSIVRLGDVARVSAPLAEEAEALASMELFPAPIPRQSRYVRSRELIDLLVRRGVDFSAWRISGANMIQVTRVERTAAEPESARQAPLRARERAEAADQVAAAIRGFLYDRLGDSLPEARRASLRVVPDLDDAQIRAVIDAPPTAVSGGRHPWIGRQQFEVRLAGDSFIVEAEITLPAGHVVAARPLPRGAMIRPADLRIEYDDASRVARASYRTMDDLIGWETATAIAAGRPITEGSVRPPIVLRRGDAVAVQVHNGGIHVRTMARAREEASAGDVIEVEAVEDRGRRFHARASGQIDPHTGLPVVELFGRGPSAGQLDETLLR